MTDGEALFYIAGILARCGHVEEAARQLRRSAEAGFLCLPAFRHDPLLAPLRARGLDRDTVAHVESRRAQVVAAFADAAGRTLLGLPPAS